MNTEETKKIISDILECLNDCQPKEADTDILTFEKYNLVMDDIFPIVQKFNLCTQECYTLMSKLEKKLRDPKEIFKPNIKDNIKLRLKDYL
jgi:hypothetical protein